MSWKDEDYEIVAPRESIMLTEKERRLLAGLVRAKRRKTLRQLATSSYVPQEGQRHMDEVNAERYWKIYHVLMDGLEPHPEHGDMYDGAKR
jgi:hypothetical protein